MMSHHTDTTRFTRLREAIHPQRYGFFLDPDGAFTLLGAAALTVMVAVLVDLGGIISAWTRQLDASLGLSAVLTAVIFAVATVPVAITMRMLISRLVPADHDRIAHFHAWIAGLGALLAVGVVTVCSAFAPLLFRSSQESRDRASLWNVLAFGEPLLVLGTLVVTLIIGSLYLADAARRYIPARRAHLLAAIAAPV